MKAAIIGSRSLTEINIEDYLPSEITEIVSGGEKGIDTLARKYSEKHGIKLTEFLPNYKRYGRGAPLKRNLQIIDYADVIIAFWDGTSKGTKFVIDTCQKRKKKIQVYRL